MKKFPTVSVVIATFNSKNTIDKCLTSVRNQNYPQDKISIIICDGGSNDSTLTKIKKYKVDLIKIPPDKQNAEYNKGVGVRSAKGDFLLMIDHDNVLPHKDWLSKMIKPLLDDKKIVGVETLRYRYEKKGTLLDRYFALFGAGDPLAYYLGKADRLSFIYDEYNLSGKVLKNDDYYVVEFNKKQIPTLGANGFLIRRKLLIENAKVDENHFFHIDVNVDLIKKGFKRYAFVKDDIIHLTGYKDVSHFLYRRKLFMEQFHIKAINERRYSVYMPQDRWKLVKFLIYSLTFVKPLVDSIRGYIKIQDSAWFLHPVLCFTLTLIYGSVTIKNYFIKS